MKEKPSEFPIGWDIVKGAPTGWEIVDIENRFPGTIFPGEHSIGSPFRVICRLIPQDQPENEGTKN